MESGVSILTSKQIRMARACLSWSVAALAEKSLVSVSTVKRLETETGFSKATKSNITAVQKTFEAEGVEFIGLQDEGPGVRLWPRKRADN